MQVRFVDGQGVRSCEPDDVVELFAHDDGFYWIDVPAWDDEAEALLTGLGCHAMVIEGCRQRNYVPMVHGYEDQVFVTSQSPYLGHAGHVHLLELDQIIAHHFLVTVHGPINPDLDVSVALVETSGVLARLESGRYHPKTPGRALVRRHLGRRAPAAGRDRRGLVEAARAGEGGDGLQADRPRAAAGDDVPDPPRAHHHTHDGGASATTSGCGWPASAG